MGELFVKTIIIMAVLLFFAVPGFILKKLNLMGDGAKTTLGNILLYVCQPALILASFTVFSDSDYAEILAVGRTTLLINFAITAAISVVAILIVFALCKVIFVRYKNRPAADVYTFLAIFSNCGFLGVPFIDMLTDGDAVAVMYLMMFNLVFAIMVWTLGVYLITRNAKEISAKKVLLNPTIIASALALLLFFVPEINFFMFDGCKELGTIPSALSTMTAPISMILVGIALADLPIRSLFNKAEIYISGALRLIVAPLLTFAVSAAFFFITRGYTANAVTPSDYIFLAPVIAMCMSPASIVVAMTERYGGEKDIAAAAYTTNTLFSLITVPLMMLCVYAMWNVVV